MCELIDTHRELLESWRHAMNLVGPGALDAHYEDSGLAMEGLTPEGRWADLGTGAGFPGVVLCGLHPDLHLDLVDSRKKRCVFLEEVFSHAKKAAKEGTHWNARVLCQRVEDLPEEAYDGIVARAFAPPAHVLDHALRLLCPGGVAVLMLAQGQPVPEPPEGLRFLGERRYEVQGKLRCVREYQRVEQLPEAAG